MNQGLLSGKNLGLMCMTVSVSIILGTKESKSKALFTLQQTKSINLCIYGFRQESSLCTHNSLHKREPFSTTHFAKKKKKNKGINAKVPNLKVFSKSKDFEFRSTNILYATNALAPTASL